MIWYQVLYHKKIIRRHGFPSASSVPDLYESAEVFSGAIFNKSAPVQSLIMELIHSKFGITFSFSQNWQFSGSMVSRLCANDLLDRLGIEPLRGDKPKFEEQISVSQSWLNNQCVSESNVSSPL